MASGGYRWVTLGSGAQPGLGIVLSEPHAGRSQADGDAIQELLTKGVLPMTVFSTDDLDATFERVRASGAESAPGAHRPAVGAARLRVPRPVGQHDPGEPARELGPRHPCQPPPRALRRQCGAPSNVFVPGCSYLMGG